MEMHLPDKIPSFCLFMQSRSLCESKRQMIKLDNVTFLSNLTLRILALSWLLLTYILYKVDGDPDLDLQKRRTTDI